jgi:hypothetical protein
MRVYTGMPHRGYGAEYDATLEALQIPIYRVLRRVHFLLPPDPVLAIRQRNKTIISRYRAGEVQADLAREFGISYQRIHQIIQNKS